VEGAVGRSCNGGGRVCYSRRFGRNFLSLKLAEPGTQRIETEVAGCVKRMSAIVSQTTLHAAALSCLSVI
jgi:hypothetical protein